MCSQRTTKIAGELYNFLRLKSDIQIERGRAKSEYNGPIIPLFPNSGPNNSSPYLTAETERLIKMNIFIRYNSNIGPIAYE